MLQLQERLDDAMQSKTEKGCHGLSEPAPGITKPGVRLTPPKLRLIPEHGTWSQPTFLNK